MRAQRVSPADFSERRELLAKEGSRGDLTDAGQTAGGGSQTHPSERRREFCGFVNRGLSEGIDVAAERLGRPLRIDAGEGSEFMLDALDASGRFEPHST